MAGTKSTSRRPAAGKGKGKGKSSAYRFGDDQLTDTVAITIFAGHIWARDRHFDTSFNPEAYEQDRRLAEALLCDTCSGMGLREVINAMINTQAEVNWLRKVRNGYQGLQSSTEFDEDRHQAERFVAFLFFDAFLRDFLKTGAWPAYGVGLKESLVDLFKTLPLDEFARISGYLEFLDRRSRIAEGAHGYHADDYLSAFGALEKVWTALRPKRAISRAKVASFVKKHPALVEQVVRDAQGASVEGIDPAVDILKSICEAPLDRAATVMEFLLACMAISGAGASPRRVTTAAKGKSPATSRKRSATGSRKKSAGASPAAPATE
jgi:hypothetical protein